MKCNTNAMLYDSFLNGIVFVYDWNGCKKNENV